MPNPLQLSFDHEATLEELADVGKNRRRLPRLFDSAAVTTNFDRVLETAYANEGRAFVEKVTGRGMANAFFRAIPAGERTS